MRYEILRACDVCRKCHWTMDTIYGANYDRYSVEAVKTWENLKFKINFPGNPENFKNYSEQP
jgi:hypothetical protein